MASTALRRPIGHEDRLSLVDHLDELRSRLVVCTLALAIAFGLCLWQNGPLLKIVNRPLDRQTQHNVERGRGPLGQTYVTQEAVRGVGRAVQGLGDVLLAPGSGLKPEARVRVLASLAEVDKSLKAIPARVPGNKPITLGLGEPFSATMRVSLYFALLLAMPFVLWQLYAFVLPAFSREERRIAIPLLTMVPGLFIAGVAVGYFLVLPAAVKFLQGFNTDQFNVLVQARDYYRFVALTLLAMGIVFQVPVGILALTRTGVVPLRVLRKNRRYAIVACAVIATPLPGTDPVSMILETLMLYVLYEVGILISAFVGRAREQIAELEDQDGASP